MITYTGLLAPEETLTGDGRIFAAGKGRWREHVPIMFKNKSGGHGEAPVVGTLRGQTFAGPGGTWGTVEFMDPEIVPEVIQATYMLDKRAVGPSVDLSPEYTVEVIPHPMRPDKKAGRFTDYMVVGVTLVPMPAFGEVHLSADKEEHRALLASAGVDLDHVTYFDINQRAWDSWPLAEREMKYDADDAVKRIAQWAGIGTKTPSLDHYASAFLWRNGQQTGDSLAQDSFRLPLCDIINGQPHLVYHAVYAAAALLSGGHGGLPNIPAEDQEAMKGVINTIYAKMAQQYGDSGMKSPFDPAYTNRRPEQGQMAVAVDDFFENDEPIADIEATFAMGEKGVTTMPTKPNKKAFENPRLASPTRITVTEDGRIFGHVAPWKQCHVGVGNSCVIAPKSRTDYAYFKNGEVVTDDGTTVRVGKITVGAGHANDKWGVMPARDHYDNTAWAAAVVNIGEDRHGIWISGVLTPNADENMVATLRRSQLSGDWRRVNGNLELIAALAVNSPGFPVVSYQDGGVFSMQGIGVIEETEPVQDHNFGIIEVIDESDLDLTLSQFAARLEELESKRQKQLVEKRANQLEEIEARRQGDVQKQDVKAEQAANPGQSTTMATSIARQMDCKFVVLPEPADDGKGDDKEDDTAGEEVETTDTETTTTDTQTTVTAPLK